MSNYATSLKRDLIRRYHHLGFLVCLVVSACSAASQPKPVDFRDFKRILFLGDSITYSGQYVAYVEAAYRKLSPNLETSFSIWSSEETVSGLSEPGHANGRFLVLIFTSDLTESSNKLSRSRRCLLWYEWDPSPFSEARFEAYKRDNEAENKTEEANAQLILLTPLTFDSRRSGSEHCQLAIELPATLCRL